MDDTELLMLTAFGVVFLLAGVAAFWQHYLAPRRRRQVFLETGRARGWTVVGAGAPEWQRFLGVARPGPQEFTKAGDHREKLGPVSLDFKVETTEKDFTGDVFRLPSASHPRLAAAVSWTRQRSTSTTLSRERNNAGFHQLWVGEVRPLPVSERTTAYDAFQALFGDALRQRASARGVPVETLDHGETISSDDLSRAVREVLERNGAGRDLQATVHLAPDAWVLSLPQARGVPRLDEVLSLVDALSQTLDRASG